MDGTVRLAFSGELVAEMKSVGTALCAEDDWAVVEINLPNFPTASPRGR